MGRVDVCVEMASDDARGGGAADADEPHGGACGHDLERES